jgi:DNA-binding transcriptional ArsR family regulator
MKRTTEDSIDQLFYALSDQNRRKMLLRLSKESLTATELEAPLGITKQAVSKHLKVLEEAGLVSKKKDGRLQHCHFNPHALDPIQIVIQQYKEYWGHQLNALEDYIEKAKQNKKEIT